MVRVSEEELQLAKRLHRRETGSVTRIETDPVTAPNEEWAMDFDSDTLFDGGRFGAFTLIDTHPRQALQIQARRSMSGLLVIQFLDLAVIEYGKPKRIRCDNGPEFIDKDLDPWCHQNGVELHVIKPGMPTENYAEPLGLDHFRKWIRWTILHEGVSGAQQVRRTVQGDSCRGGH